MKKIPDIDEAYFKKYAGSGKPYDKVYREHAMIEECIELFSIKGAPKIKKLCVLGTATGKCLKDFDKGLGLIPYGCEVSEWAFKKIPPKYRRRIRHQDMRDYVTELFENKKYFELVFSNAFIYLDKKDILPLLKKLAKVTRYVHYCSSFKGKACPDPWRKTLESYKWWNQQFKKAGFQEHRTAKGKATFLWESKAV